MKLTSFLIAVVILAGCSDKQRNFSKSEDWRAAAVVGPVNSAPGEKDGKGDVIGPWKNRYKRNPDLAGVIVIQLPEVPEELPAYRNQHPSAINYVFWNGKIEKFAFSPNGEVVGEASWIIEKGDDLWKEVDFRAGSDPEFLRHQDPRGAESERH